MPNSLYKALELDLRNIKDQNDENLKAYLRYLIKEAYYEEIKNDTSYTNNYILNQKRNNISVKTELINLSPLSKKYLNDEQLLDHLAEYIYQIYLQRKNMPISFFEVMERTLDYYKDNFSDEIDDIRYFAIKILNNYIYSDNIRVFSSKNYTRAYVLENGKDNIINEMENTVDNVDISKLVNNYATVVANSYFLKKEDKKNYNLDDIQFQIRDKIINARLNKMQKYHLINALNDGDIEEVLIYIPYLDKNLINAYKKAKEVNENSYSM